VQAFDGRCVAVSLIDAERAKPSRAAKAAIAKFEESARRNAISAESHHHMASGIVPNLSGCAARSTRCMMAPDTSVAPGRIARQPNSARRST
jgi:hypothetical protein